jgi:hypothetical protein
MFALNAAKKMGEAGALRKKIKEAEARLAAQPEPPRDSAAPKRAAETPGQQVRSDSAGVIEATIVAAAPRVDVKATAPKQVCGKVLSRIILGAASV